MACRSVPVLRSETAVATAFRIRTEANPFFKIITDGFAKMLARVAWVTVLDFFMTIPKNPGTFRLRLTSKYQISSDGAKI